VADVMGRMSGMGELKDLIADMHANVNTNQLTATLLRSQKTLARECSNLGFTMQSNDCHILAIPGHLGLVDSSAKQNLCSGITDADKDESLQHFS
jgi:hypothetical protein